MDSEASKASIIEIEAALPFAGLRRDLPAGDWAVRWVSSAGRTIAEMTLVDGRAKLTADERAFAMMVEQSEVSCEALIASPIDSNASPKPSRKILAQLRALEHCALYGCFLPRHCR